MRNLHLILVLAASLPPLATAQAAPADLPETGQITCFNAGGTAIPCPTTGQDGDLKAGVAWPNPRFTVGTGTTADCVTDNLTGLIWVRAPSTVPAIWTAALASANGLTLCGFTDWRLPNVNELESLVNANVPDATYASVAAFLNAQGFSNVQAGFYWSSSSYAGSADSAWNVTLNNSVVTATKKSVSNFVWPVRAGQ